MWSPIAGLLALAAAPAGLLATDPTPASLVRALESIDDLDLGGYRVGYSPAMHKGSAFVDVNVINASGDITR